METRAIHLGKIYAMHEREPYQLYSWLRECVAKRKMQGKEISIEHLENCSTMQKIVRLALRTAYKYDGVEANAFDRIELRSILANKIMEEI